MIMTSVLTGDDAFAIESTMADHPEPKEPAPTAKNYPSNLKVLLDIDETMLFTKYFASEAAAQAYVRQLEKEDDPKIKKALRKLMNCVTRKKKLTYQQFLLHDNTVFHVNIRPGLETFLKEVATTFETHIYTAGTATYAKGIAAMLDPDGSYFGDRIWSLEHCHDVDKDGNKKFTNDGYPVIRKDISKLPFDKEMDRVVLIDDAVANLKANPRNMILAKQFMDDPNDTELKKVLRMLKQFKKNTVDIRPILDKENERQLWFCSLFE